MGAQQGVCWTDPYDTKKGAVDINPTNSAYNSYGGRRPGLGYDNQTSWFDRAALMPSPPEVADGMLRMTEECSRLQNLHVDVVDGLVFSPFDGMVGATGKLLSVDFGRNPTTEGPFEKDLRRKAYDANIPNAANSDFVVLELWGGGDHVVSRAHVLNPLDALRKYGGYEAPLIVQLPKRDGTAFCVCGLPQCPRNQKIQEKASSMLTGWLPTANKGPGADTLMKAGYREYNVACYTCKKTTEFWRTTILSGDNRKNEYCPECGHITFYHEIASNDNW